MSQGVLISNGPCVLSCVALAGVPSESDLFGFMKDEVVGVAPVPLSKLRRPRGAEDRHTSSSSSTLGPANPTVRMFIAS